MKYFTTNLQQTAQTILQHIYDRLTQTIMTDYCERYVMKYFTTNLQQTYNKLTTDLR